MFGSDMIGVGAFLWMWNSHNLWGLIFRGELSAAKDQLEICLGALKEDSVDMEYIM